MKKTSSPFMPAFMVVIALTAWFALGLQLYIMISNSPGNGLTLTGAVIQFLSFFTILSNILVAVSLSFSLLKPASGPGRFFSTASVRSAIALYIMVVGIVYNLVLRNLWDPKGLQLVADELLHVAVPLLYFFFWFIFTPKGALQWKNTTGWLIFPLAYLIYTLLRGAIVNWYPYPFMNVPDLGYLKVLLNCIKLLAAFLGTGLLLIAVNRLMKRGL